jgi:hypothetical protein
MFSASFLEIRSTLPQISLRDNWFFILRGIPPADPMTGWDLPKQGSGTALKQHVRGD